MGLCRNYHPTDELARDSLTCSKTHHTDQCQSAQTENINGTGTALTDNLGSHKGQAVRAAIRTAKAHLLFLPPYSPDRKRVLTPTFQSLP
jgi:transposase